MNKNIDYRFYLLFSYTSTTLLFLIYFTISIFDYSVMLDKVVP
jgi:hypothetical protein